ncbi:MAG: HipA family kinase [Ginsengibacter sp.]
MLPVYKAISFNKIIKKGGRTEPWIVIVNAGNTLKPYVVKLFESKLIETRDSVTNEVVGNVLAREFNIPVPNAALIDLDEDFVETIKDREDLLQILDERDYRIKFGSELLEGYFNFDYKAFSLKDVRKIIDIDNVYAFDNLIRNRDRNGVLKPNILIKSTNAFLIDHELGFEDINDGIVNDMKNWKWDRRFCDYHIFYNFLKNSPVKIKKEYFHEFGEYLKYLNVSTLEPYFSQLVGLGFNGNKHKLIQDYLSKMKQNSSNFTTIMLTTIS